MNAYQVASWTGFFSVTAEVAATLTGLVFVAISINLGRILEFPLLISRAGESILQMFGALIVCILALLPGQGALLVGIELALAGVVLWAMQTVLHYRSLSSDEAPRPRPISSIVLSQIAVVPFPVGGILIALGMLGGLYCVAAGVILSIIAGVSSAWVMLVEILR